MQKISKNLLSLSFFFSVTIQSHNVSAIDTESYIGSDSCTQCHPKQNEAWRGSHHDLSMQHATNTSVLGNFDNKHFEYNGITTTFFKKDGTFFVNTDGPDGTLQNFQIKYTFGVTPLQQYLIELPGGHLQAFGIAWDSRSKERGGQRWFHLYPSEAITYTDPLHWSKVDQNWNYMCADCHSTNLQKNYNSSNNTYNTQWSEINVACEACHGPGAHHVNWAEKKSGWEKHADKGLVIALDERSGVSWSINHKTGNAKRSSIKETDKEIEICARCHSRRYKIKQNYANSEPLLDSYQPALLTDFLYHPDGQIKEEVFVYGSFVQSKMYHAGVTCSDCHDPHSLTLRADGNGVCLQCHDGKKYNASSHHFHKKDSVGSKCAECHMPQTNYMIVDGRHDHSIRIPRPDLSLTTGSPNACNNCHASESFTWADKKMKRWYGKDWVPGWHFGETLSDASKGAVGVSRDLAALAASSKLPAIARATAADLLQAYPDPTTYVVVKQLLQDKNPMIRRSALQTLDTMEIQHRLSLGTELLTDPVRAVRIEAGRILAIVPDTLLTRQQAHALKSAVQEYRQAQNVNAERPESHINLGLLDIRLQHFDDAEKSYKHALKLNPEFINTYVNLADLYRLQQQDDKAEQVLKEALQISDKNADIYHALGLLYVRKQQMKKALNALATAHRLHAGNARYGYVYAVALDGQGLKKQAIHVLENVYQQHPSDRDTLIALITFHRAAGRQKDALIYAENLQALMPGNVELINLIQELKAGSL